MKVKTPEQLEKARLRRIKKSQVARAWQAEGRAFSRMGFKKSYGRGFCKEGSLTGFLRNKTIKRRVVNEVGIVEKIKNDKDFWKTASWVAYTNKYNERLISFMAPWSGSFNIPVVNLTPGDYLKEDSRLVSWNKTQPFFEAFMERICLCLNYCKDKTNEELLEEL